jgi:hypothetical protein
MMNPDHNMMDGKLAHILKSNFKIQKRVMNPRTVRSVLTILACFFFSLAETQQLHDSISLTHADALFISKEYAAAGKIYRRLLTDSSLDAFHLNRLGYTELEERKLQEAKKHFMQALAAGPIAPVKASVFSRLAMLASQQNQDQSALVFLDSAIGAGYISLPEMDSSASFVALRSTAAFKALRQKLFNSLYPCYNDPKAREFDFWVGEWDVFVTGTAMYAGNSVIEKISGGCAILENWKSSVSEGKSLNFIDDSSLKWKQVWVGSYPNGKQDFVNGEYKDSAMRFTFSTRDAQGKFVQGKFTFFNEGQNQVRQLNETSSDNGKTWIVNYDFTYKRKS